VTLVLDGRLRAAIAQHGERDYPREACGLIGGTVEGERKVAARLEPLANLRDDSPRDRYLISPDAFRDAAERLARDGLEVVGVYHSHPDHPPRPSAFDLEHAWPWLSYVIVGVAHGRAEQSRVWILAEDRRAFVEEPLMIEDRKVAWPLPS